MQTIVTKQHLNRPESAGPKRQFGDIAKHLNTEPNESVFLHDKIILPLKEYSNKFLRENKPRDQILYNHSFLKPKKTLLYTRKELKNRRAKLTECQKEKENEIQRIKTEESSIHTTANKSFALSTCSNHDRKENLGLCSSTRNQFERISTSRALEIFSKVFKNESIERMKLRKEITSKTSDVHVKQVTLQGKIDKKARLTITHHRKMNAPMPTINHTSKSRRLFLEEENFELAGW